MSDFELDVITIGRSSVDLYGQQIGSRLEDIGSFSKAVGGCPANIAIGTAAGIDDDLLAMATPKDAAFAVSFAPYASESAAQARGMAARGVPVVSLTDSALSPLADCSKEWFELVEADHAGFRSLSASMAFAMALTVSIAEARRR